MKYLEFSQNIIELGVGYRMNYFMGQEYIYMKHRMKKDYNYINLSIVGKRIWK